MKLLRRIIEYAARLIDDYCSGQMELDSHKWASKMEIIGRLESPHG